MSALATLAKNCQMEDADPVGKQPEVEQVGSQSAGIEGVPESQADSVDVSESGNTEVNEEIIDAQASSKGEEAGQTAETPPEREEGGGQSEEQGVEAGGTEGAVPASNTRPDEAGQQDYAPGHDVVNGEEGIEQIESEQPQINISGHVTEEDVYDALLAAALDAEVSESAGIALGVLGGRAEGKLVERAAEMIAMHTKALSDAAIRGGMCHRAALYRVVKSVLSTSPTTPDGPAPSTISQEVAEHLAGLAVTDVLVEPTRQETGKEVQELRESASAVLSQLASTHMSSVLLKLLPRLEVATMFEQQQAQKQKLYGRRLAAEKADSRQDHFIRVLDMIQHLAKARKEQLGPHFKRVLSAMLPVMGVAVSNQTKQAWAGAMITCCEAVQYIWQEAEAGASEKEKLDAGGLVGRERDQALEYAVQAAYDVVATTWTSNKDTGVQQAAFLSLAAMTCLMPTETLDERLSSVITKLCQLLQSLNVGGNPRDRGQGHGTASLLLQAAALTNSLRSVAEAATNRGQVLGQHSGEVLVAILPVACCPPDYLDRATQAAYKNALVLLEALARVDPVAVTEFLLSYIHPDRRARKQLVAEPARLQWGCLSVLNHLARRVEKCMEGVGDDLLVSLAALSSSPDPLVRIQIADLIMVIAPQGLLDREGGSVLVRFLVASAAGCITGPNTTTVRQGFFGRKVVVDQVETVSGRAWWWPRSGGGGSAEPKAQLQQVAGTALYLLASTVQNVDPLLWPHLLSFLGEATYARAQAGVCRGIAVVVKKMKEGGRPIAVDYQTHPSLLSAPALVARLFPPLFSRDRKSVV